MPRLMTTAGVLILALACFDQCLALDQFSKFTTLVDSRFANTSATFSGVADVVCCHKCQTKNGCIAVNVNDVDSTCEVIMDVDSGPGAVTTNSPGWTLYYLENPAVCLDLWSEFNGECYIIQHARLIWDAANAGCGAMHPSATLAYVASAEQQQFLANLVDSTSPDMATDWAHWIGGYKDAGSGLWVWPDTKALADGYQNWGTGQPQPSGEDCLTVQGGADAYTWHDYMCSCTYKSVCKYKL